jgi:ABC-type transporter Mla MlaB component
MTLHAGPPLPIEPGASVLILRGSIAHADVAALCERARALLERRRAGLIICDVATVVDPDATTVDALARLQLTALRLGGRIVLRDPCGELQDLISFAGLADVLPLVLRVEPIREPEQRKEALGVQEEADPGDLAV